MVSDASTDTRVVPTYPPTLWALLEQRAAATPDRVLLEDEHGRVLTAAQWRDRALEVAAALYARGIGEGTPVSWQLPTTVESAVLLFALARLGARQNPVIPMLRRREVTFITRQTGARLLITPSVWRNFDYAGMAQEVAAEVGCEVMVVDRDGLPSGDPGDLPPPPSAEGAPVRHVYFSSGTTADPKGGMHTDFSAMSSANGLLTYTGVNEDDCVPVPFPYTHIGGMAMTVACLTVGCRMLFIETFDPVTSPQVIADHGGSVLGSAVPFFHAYIEAQKRHGSEPLFPRARGFFSGGAPKPPELHYEMKELFGVVGIISSWGLTEFPIATGCTFDDSDEDLANTEGRPVPGVELRVVSPDGNDLPAGEEGELRARYRT